MTDEFPDAEWRSNDGVRLTLRAIRLENVQAVWSFVRGLSFGARYFRFGKGDIEFTEDEVRRVCEPDPRECVHVLVLSDGDGAETVVGSARIVFKAGETTCQLAIAVADDWQSSGIGTRLVEALIHSARRRGLAQIQAEVLATNRGMMEFLQRRGFTLSDSPRGPGLRIAHKSVSSDG